MTTVADILAYIETLAPMYMKEEWDHVGLNCGHLSSPVTRILVALDPFEEAIDEAKAFGAELLVTHHALLHDPGFLTDATPAGKRALYLIENGIAHINAHTNLDLAPDGVNACLAAQLGLTQVQILDPAGTDRLGQPYGLLRAGAVPQQALSAFLALVKARLDCAGLRYIDADKPVHRVAVGGGSCGELLREVRDAGCDTFVTSDIKYNYFREAHDLGLNLIDAGHFHTEVPVCRYLTDQLQAAFPEITVRCSENQCDHMKFFV